REYYFNNAGKQMKMLGESVKARYLEQLGDAVAFPEDGYQGAYIRDIAATLVQEHKESLRGAAASGLFKDAAERAIFADIEATLRRMGIHFDVYFNEDSLYKDGEVERTITELYERELAFDHDGAKWLRGEPLGLDKDRVLVKSSGEPAYRLPDIAYHKNKFNPVSTCSSTCSVPITLPSTKTCAPPCGLSVSTSISSRRSSISSSR
ncbi:MAG: hypothetical protein HY270_24285, partial [Deltaproteobacteria bacterium]|nr:hypothetical protein [Deltaproteobacteria bacterium]